MHHKIPYWLTESMHVSCNKILWTVAVRVGVQSILRDSLTPSSQRNVYLIGNAFLFRFLPFYSDCRCTV